MLAYHPRVIRGGGGGGWVGGGRGGYFIYEILQLTDHLAHWWSFTFNVSVSV